MITLEMYLMGRDSKYPCPEDVKKNACVLLDRVNRLLASANLKEPPKVASGWRPAEVNAATPGASKKSNHITGNAVDIADPHGTLGLWCLSNLSILEECGLFLENPRHTPTWAHLQQVSPASGRRVFNP